MMGSVAMKLALSFPYGPFLNPFWLSCTQHNSLHINTGQMNAVRVELAWLYNLFHLDNRDPRRRSHYRIKVPRCLAENQVAPAIGLPCLDQSEIGLQSAFHHILAAVKLAHLFAFRYYGACACRREKSRNTGAASAYALRQRALRIQLQLHFAREHKLL